MVILIEGCFVKFNRLLFLAVLFVAGCATSTVTLIEKPGALSENTPSNEKSRPGIVRYFYSGLAPSVRLEQQSKAEKLMKETCGGDYSVSEKGLDLVQDIPQSKTYWYVKFNCN